MSFESFQKPTEEEFLSAANTILKVWTDRGKFKPTDNPERLQGRLDVAAALQSDAEDDEFLWDKARKENAYLNPSTPKYQRAFADAFARFLNSNTLKAYSLALHSQVKNANQEVVDKTMAEMEQSMAMARRSTQVVRITQEAVKRSYIEWKNDKGLFHSPEFNRGFAACIAFIADSLDENSKVVISAVKENIPLEWKKELDNPETLTKYHVFGANCMDLILMSLQDMFRDQWEEDDQLEAM